MVNLTPIRLPQEEDHQEYDQYSKINKGITLLSLDYMVPLYDFLLVPTQDPQAFKQMMRDILIKTPPQHSNIAGQTTDKPFEFHFYHMFPAKRYFDAIQAKYFYWWLHNIFIDGAESFRAYNRWKSCLLRAQNTEQQWTALALPERLSEKARQLFIQLIDEDPLDAMEDVIFQKERSLWDTRLFARHNLYAEIGSISVEISLTITQLRCRYFMGWLAQQLTMEELDIFRNAASRITFEKQDQLLPEIATQLLPDMDDPTKMYDKEIL